MSTLRELEAAATPGPWRLWDKRGHPTRDERDPLTQDTSKWTGKPLDQSTYGVVVNGRNFSPLTFADAALIAATRNALPLLLDVVDAARVVMAEWDALGPTGTSSTLRSHKALRAKLAALDSEPLP